MIMTTLHIYPGQRAGLPYHSRATYETPRDVLNDSSLDALQKRAILSSWACDLFAVEDCPWLRAVPGIKAPLPLRDILGALRTLDDEDDPPPRGGAVVRLGAARRRRRMPFAFSQPSKRS
jgi:hypothetical protein